MRVIERGCGEGKRIHLSTFCRLGQCSLNLWQEAWRRKRMLMFHLFAHPVASKIGDIEKEEHYEPWTR